MGIKFNCPNGHRLNVKAYLAGKRGICPHCGTKFIVPLQTAEVVESGSQGARTPAPVESQPAELADEDFAFTLPTPAAANAAPSPATAATSSAEQPRNKKVKLPDPSPDVAASDPIAAAPAALWYVRPRSGGQFGPAAADIMRTWLAEGRVAADSLVWREGWTDWQPAGELFSQLNPAVAQPAPTKNKSASASEPPEMLDEAEPGINVTPTDPGDLLKGRKRRTKRKSNNWVVIALAVVAVVLIILFIFVLFGSKAPSKPASESPQASSSAANFLAANSRLQRGRWF